MHAAPEIQPIHGVIQLFPAAIKAENPSSAMSKLAAEMPFGVAPARDSRAALDFAHSVERDFKGRREDSADMAVFYLLTAES